MKVTAGGAGGEESPLTGGEAKVQFTVRSPSLLGDERMDRLVCTAGEAPGEISVDVYGLHLEP